MKVPVCVALLGGLSSPASGLARFLRPPCHSDRSQAAFARSAATTRMPPDGAEESGMCDTSAEGDSLYAWPFWAACHRLLQGLQDSSAPFSLIWPRCARPNQ